MYTCRDCGAPIVFRMGYKRKDGTYVSTKKPVPIHVGGGASE